MSYTYAVLANGEAPPDNHLLFRCPGCKVSAVRMVSHRPFKAETIKATIRAAGWCSDVKGEWRCPDCHWKEDHEPE